MMMGEQNEFQVDLKITLDARSITKTTSQTEVMIFKRGEEFRFPADMGPTRPFGWTPSHPSGFNP